jgi:very-short-patch-repair endonuclease
MWTFALDSAVVQRQDYSMSPRFARFPYRRDLLQKARALRKKSTLGEVLLWRAIKGRQLGCEFHRQVPVGEYIVDFFCHEKGLAVEIDGSTHDHEEQFLYDQKRQAWLEGKGIRVVRFAEMEARANLDGVVDALQHWVDGIG